MSKEGIVTIRLSQEEIDQLDVHTGVVSRSQVVRVLIQDFLARTEEEQREFLKEKTYKKPG
ncbi:ribbon-helix-helix protein, CopG family [Candidatus Bathyarchaeota archaeon]|jgi:metal-responsive CopG/Arc/MetJ family transcriptional regulator|nr:ribbon-helix-helix protein, CopG family [Candidatus Bathyarchaeota archaeon]